MPIYERRGHEMISLSKALAEERLEEFIIQEEARGLEADRQEVDKAIRLTATRPQSAD